MHECKLCPRFHGSVNPSYTDPMIRLYVEAALAAGTTVEATEGQAHYLGSVMRRTAGDMVHLFNGRDGEWACRIASLSRGKATLAAETPVQRQGSTYKYVC